MDKVVCSAKDVRMLMMQHEKMFDAVDLDPYGTPSTLLDEGASCRGWRVALHDGDRHGGAVREQRRGAGRNTVVPAPRQVLSRAGGAHLAERRRRGGRAVQATHRADALRTSIFTCAALSGCTAALRMPKLAPTKVSYVYQCVGCDTFEMQPVGKTVVKGTATKYQGGSGRVVPKDCRDWRMALQHGRAVLVRTHSRSAVGLRHQEAGRGK